MWRLPCGRVIEAWSIEPRRPRPSSTIASLPPSNSGSQMHMPKEGVRAARLTCFRSFGEEADTSIEKALRTFLTSAVCTETYRISIWLQPVRNR